MTKNRGINCGESEGKTKSLEAMAPNIEVEEDDDDADNDDEKRGCGKH